jgi:hypothetical protein
MRGQEPLDKAGSDRKLYVSKKHILCYDRSRQENNEKIR